MTVQMCWMIVFRLYLFFIFLCLFIFNWRISALQCLVGFPHTTTWIGHKYIIHSSVSRPPTSRHPTLSVVTEHHAGLPMLYSNFPLASYFTYGSGDVSMLLSQFVTLSFSSWAHKSFLYICVSISALQLFTSTTLQDSMCMH